jgi:hypothetical protein
MKVVPLEKTDLTLADVAKLAKKETVILTRNGKPYAAVKDLSSSDWEAVSLASNPRFRALIEESRRSYQLEGGTTLEDMFQELGLRVKRPAARRRKKSRD